MSETLFPDFDDAVAEYERVMAQEAERVANLSAGQRLTLRQADDVAAGRHPLTGGRLHPLASRHRDADAPKTDPFTCGSCLFRKSEKYHGRSYAKCWLPNPAVGADAPIRQIYSRVTYGAASDVRAWWPACPDYSPGDTTSPDAARWIPDETTESEGSR